MRRQSFYWVVNLKDQRVERSNGVLKELGFPDNPTSSSENLTLQRIYQIVHPDMQEATQAQRIKAAYYLKTNFKGKIKPLSDDFLYNIRVAFVNVKGEYVYVKQKSTAFQLDQEGNMVSYISYHEIIGDYNNDAPSLEIFINGLRQKNLEKEILQGATKHIKLPFTPRQIDILKFLAYHDDADKFITKPPSDKTLASMLVSVGISLKESSVKTLRERALHKASITYGVEYKRLIDLALYLKKFKLI